MNRVLACLITLTSLSVGSLAARDTEKKVSWNDLPAPVRDAVKQHSEGYKVLGYAREAEDGAVRYEAEMKSGNGSKDVSFDPEGKLVSVEEQTSMGAIPAPARQAIQKAAGTHKISLVESVSENGSTFYEGHYRSGLRVKEVKVDAAGKLVE